MTSKRCPACGWSLPLADFYRGAGYCKGCSRWKRREWAEQNRDRLTDLARARRRAHPGYFSRVQTVIQSRLRAEVLAAYGGTCGRCGQADTRVLTVEHKAGGGKQDLIRSKCLWTILRRIKAEGFPDTYAVLCRNCNMLHGSNPRRQKDGPVHRRTAARRSAREAVLAHYGNRCGWCGTAKCLDLDHGHGWRDPRYVGCPRRGTGATATWIINYRAWEQFQLLCQNCNWLKRLGECRPSAPRTETGIELDGQVVREYPTPRRVALPVAGGSFGGN